MTTNTLHTASTRASRQPSAQPAKAAVAVRASWVERLAAWAERRPSHRRLGCWTAG